MSLKWIDSDPMFGYKLKSKNVERSFLTEDELTKMRSLKAFYRRNTAKIYLRSETSPNRPLKVDR